MKNILITGITGQDGLFLTKELLKYPKTKIFGISRNNDLESFKNNLISLGIKQHENIKILNTNLFDKNAVNNLIIEIKPDFIYNLSGPSSVYRSIKYPEIGDQIHIIFENLTNACISNKQFPSFFQASSSEMFEISANKLDENSKINPRNPYSRAKQKNHLKVLDFFNNYDWKIHSGILFNHESEFRKN